MAKTVPPHSSNPRTHCADWSTSAVDIFRAISTPHNATFSNTAMYPVSPLSSHPSTHPPRKIFNSAGPRVRLRSPPFFTLISPFFAMYFKEVILFILRQHQTSDHNPRFSPHPQRTPHALPLQPRLLAPHSRTQSPRAEEVDIHDIGVEDGVDAYERLAHASLTPSVPLMAKSSSIRRRNGVLPLPNARRQDFPAPAEPHSLVSQSRARGSVVCPQLRGKGINNLACTKLGLAREASALWSDRRPDLLALPVAPPAGTSSSPLRNRGLRARRDGVEGRLMPDRRLGMHLRATAHEAVGRFRKEVDALLQQALCPSPFGRRIGVAAS
ncbi:hypothetical protein V8E53_007683 [Lactarius tabidus]